MIPLAEHGEHVRRAEAAGYTDIWSGETNGPDGFTPLALAAAWTEKVRLGTGVVGVITPRAGRCSPSRRRRSPTPRAGASSLGIGASSDRIVEGWNGMPLRAPADAGSRRRSTSCARRSRASAPRRLQARAAPPEHEVPDRARGAARQDAEARGREGRRRLHQLPAARRPAAGDRAARAARRRASSSSAASSASPASASRSSRWRASCSPPTSPCPVYEDFFRWLGHGEEIDRDGRGLGRPRTARRRPRRRPGS